MSNQKSRGQDAMDHKTPILKPKLASYSCTACSRVHRASYGQLRSVTPFAVKAQAAAVFRRASYAPATLPLRALFFLKIWIPGAEIKNILKYPPPAPKMCSISCRLRPAGRSLLLPATKAGSVAAGKTFNIDYTRPFRRN